MEDRVPYTYLLKFTNPITGEEKFYYGVKYAKDCHPDDLWIKYFTSSPQISQLRKEFGNTVFQFEIRRKFENTKDARRWETRVLKKMKVLESDKWLNNTTNEAISPEACASAAKGKIWIHKDSSEIYVSKRKLRKYLQAGWEIGRHISPKRKLELKVRAQAGLHRSPHSKDGIDNIKAAVAGMRRIYHPVTKARSKAKGIKLERLLQDGWAIGACHPDDKQKLFPKGKDSPAFGVIFTEERKQKIGLAQKQYHARRKGI